MPTNGPSNQLFFRTQPIGTITIDSAFPPAPVMENLNARGRQWRNIMVPADLKKFKVNNLLVSTKDSQFEIQWGGLISPLHNPMCFGLVQPYGSGSRIRAGFKLNTRVLLSPALFLVMSILQLFTNRTPVSWALSGILLAIVLSMVLINRSSEPMRERLIEVLSDAANTKPVSVVPEWGMMGGNGP